ncbi:hypothetical protein Tco_0821639 [Tanacetum coccineum]|uniref:Uncharacterized protein n=1 Tax=Tanacetum coccineum TaxID=301880 RepID=A0ABQ5ACU1_9ASTR
MTIAEYNLYIAKQGLVKNPLNDHSYGFTPQFVAQTPHTPNTPVDKKGSCFDKILDDLFKIGAENLKRMGQENFQNNICEQDVDDDITVKDVEWIRQFLTSNIPDVMDDVIQPLIPKSIHTTPPDKDYVAPATKLKFYELLEDFRVRDLGIIMEMEPDIENMTINEYLEYEADKKRQLWRNIQSKSSPTRPPQPHNECGYESPDENDDFVAQPPHTPNTPVDKKDSEFYDILDDFNLEKEEAQVEDGDDGDIYDI